MNYLRGYLFKEEGCPYCKKAVKAVLKINDNLYPNKRIMIKDCTNLERHGIFDDLVIKKYHSKVDGYPTILLIYSTDSGKLFILKKSGANSSIEVYAWLRGMLRNHFIIPQENKFLENINQYEFFDLDCKMRNGRMECR